MKAEIQYDLFEETTEHDELLAEIISLRTSHDKVRKSMFSRLNEVGKLLVGAVNRLEKLEKEITQLSKENKKLQNENRNLKTGLS